MLENKIAYRENEPMKNHTSFRIGGEAELFIEARNSVELAALFKKLNESETPFLVVGNGSNLLVSDSGIDFPVIKLLGDFEKVRLVDETTIYAGAGVQLASLCNFALEQSLSGLEFAFGIPGSVGGAAFMNAGAYGGEMKDVVLYCDHIDKRGNSGSFTAKELSFGYRHSVYAENGFVITGVCLKLQKGDKTAIAEKMNELIGKRKAKQPLSMPSAGSVFKRPEGYFAGALIEQSGLKGASIGGAQVSEKHAGFIVNTGGATCDDVKKLIEHCRAVVFEKFGVTLETEIKMI